MNSVDVAKEEARLRRVKRLEARKGPPAPTIGAMGSMSAYHASLLERAEITDPLQAKPAMNSK